MWREEWSVVHELRGELEEAGLRPPHVCEVSTERETPCANFVSFSKPPAEKKFPVLLG